ncbi:MAG: nucleotide pyrophosphatase, partial [Halioglobus sp.]|nr:nucleotide pyrophosphatase [Halioglobus sp.]
EVDALKAELSEKLLTLHDEKRDQPVIKTMYDGAVVYQGNANNDAPDMLVGYYSGYRASWQTTLGAVPKRLVEINRNKWSGDHCVAVDQVPGVLFTSFKLDKQNYSIEELASMVLED